MLNTLLFITFRWLDLIDILLVAIIMFQLYKLVKGTVAIRIFLGILAIYLFWKIVEALQMELLSEILGQFIGVRYGIYEVDPGTAHGTVVKSIR